MKHTFIKEIAVKRLTLPLIRPFRTALGQHDTLDNLLFNITLSDGTKGYGEAAIATHITGETIGDTERNLKTVGKKLIGQDSLNYQDISVFLHQTLPKNKAALAAIEMALLDAVTKHKKMPLWNLFGPRSRILKTDITIVIDSLEETEKSARQYYQQGFRAFKIKVGKDPDLDIKRVFIVKKAVHKSSIIIDANQGYNYKQTLIFLKTLKKYGIYPDLIEQPVPKNDWEGMKRLTKTCGIPICADETVQDLRDCLAVIQEKAANVINIKLMKSGLIQGRNIAFLARSAGLRLMIGGMMESSLAMTCSAHLAAGMGCFDFVDLDTPFFLKNSKPNPYLSSNGKYDLRKVKSGIGNVI
ncbi:MAG: dipeptide epimerase [Candidatus Omnitrophica bacterium]|nr:dipeptide epimerase [Candidatus Omnitrophota bacterium]